MPRGKGCRRHGKQFGPCSCSLGKLSRLIEPAALYLLHDGEPRYGYELLAKIPELALTDSEIDVGAVYRTLRTLEAAGYVTSEWQPGPGGPKRRMYTITPVGQQHLRDWATVMERRGAGMVGFAKKCGKLSA
jgi:DNA-binding PadR family transcriptional regulator